MKEMDYVDKRKKSILKKKAEKALEGDANKMAKLA